jgi:hypothetical protein
MEIGDIARLVAYVLPGYLATELRNLLVRTKKRNDFERLASCLFLSLVSYVLAAAGVWLAYGDQWALHTTVSLQNWCFVLLLFVFAALLGYAVARLTTWHGLQRWLYKHHVDLTEYPNVWNEIWHCEEGAPWVLVRMKDGSTVFGAVKAYSADADDTQRELWLFPVRDLDEDGTAEIAGLSVYVPGDQIASISAYRPGDKPVVTQAQDQPTGTTHVEPALQESLSD